MSDFPRASKRVKQGEDPSNEIDLFSRKELLVYQNKALASRLKVQVDENEKINKKNAFLEKTNSELISCSSLLYQQLFSLNDKLVTISNTKGIPQESLSDLREVQSISNNFALFTSSDLDQIIRESENNKNIIIEAGNKLTSLCSQIYDSSTGSEATESNLKEVMDKLNEDYQQLQIETNLSETEINDLKRKLADLNAQKLKDSERMKTLELRADRNIPYVQFEGRHFKIDHIPHE